MKLQQLRYIREVARANLNVSMAAAALNAAQPGLSSQIRQLEDELNVHIFERHGKRLTGVTPPGRAILALAEKVLSEVDNIRQVSADYSSEDSGSLAIATTHTQARYVLPQVVKAFTQRYPNVRLHMHQGSPTQIADMAASGAADIAIATEAIELFDDLVMMPCYQWNRCVIAPPAHELWDGGELTLDTIAQYPIVTYDSAFTGRSKINQAFDAAGLRPNVVLTAIDSDVIKTYVELGLGIGLLASMAFDEQRDRGLRAEDAAHLFADSTTRIGIRRGSYLRGYVYAFIELFSPHLDRATIKKAVEQ
ncbi:MAG: HTH-type transcriptional regulator CysB [Gammaproteobacteria bacterium]|nr:HTH-type transcriptional regulator CysB [Gammaproteobacteria bacterium]